jgi:hypothetical protein
MFLDGDLAEMHNKAIADDQQAAMQLLLAEKSR